MKLVHGHILQVDKVMLPQVHNVAVIGYGMSAKVFHIPLIDAVADFKLYAIVQRTPRPGDDAEKDHPGVKVYRSLRETVNDAAVDVVVITTSPDSHYLLAKEALEKEKHGMNASGSSFSHGKRLILKS